MRPLGNNLSLTATDLSNFLSCRHLTALDMAEAYGKRKRPMWEDPLLELLFKRGLEHEAKYVESLRADGRRIVNLSDVKDREDLLKQTLDAMHAGADVIVQGALRDGHWFGKPDVMQRLEKPSRLGPWSYEISDTKLALETRAGTVLQLSLYSEMLGIAQGLRPEHFYVVTPNPDGPVPFRAGMPNATSNDAGQCLVSLPGNGGADLWVKTRLTGAESPAKSRQ